MWQIRSSILRVGAELLLPTTFPVRSRKPVVAIYEHNGENRTSFRSASYSRYIRDQTGTYCELFESDPFLSLATDAVRVHEVRHRRGSSTMRSSIAMH